MLSLEENRERIIERTISAAGAIVGLVELAGPHRMSGPEIRGRFAARRLNADLHRMIGEALADLEGWDRTVALSEACQRIDADGSLPATAKAHAKEAWKRVALQQTLAMSYIAGNGRRAQI